MRRVRSHSMGGSTRGRTRSGAGGAGLALALALLSGCGGGAPPLPVVPLPAIEPPAGDGLLESPALQAVVDLQLRRDGPGLVALLADASPAVRARAAFALGSVQYDGALSALEGALADLDPRVRSKAAFALGQILLPDRAAALVAALDGETDPETRRRIFQAVGKRGAEEQILALVALAPDPATDLARVRAVAQGAIRGMRAPEIFEFLAGYLEHPDPELRMAAASHFATNTRPASWVDVHERVRAALDAYPLDEPAAMYLVHGLARLRAATVDRERIARWLREGRDWRIRATAATAVRNQPWLSDTVIIEALFEALEDPSLHVAISAATTLGVAMWERNDLQARAAQFLNQRSPRVAPVQAVLASSLASLGYEEIVVNWTRRVADVSPSAARAGIEAVISSELPQATALFRDLAGHADPVVRGAAVQAVANRAGAVGEVRDIESEFDLVRATLADPEILPMARAASGLGNRAFEPFEPYRALEAEYRSRLESSGPEVLLPLIAAMGEPLVPLLREILDSPDFRLRRAAADRLFQLTREAIPPERIGVPAPERPIDWARLAELGPSPRVLIETTRGEMVARLLPEQAPQTVQAFVETVRSGRYDGVAFHRVVPAFVIQGGDIGIGDGTGHPGDRLTTEVTLLPFARGVLGMASSGKDTEGWQFFITHTPQPQLEDSYTAFGWLESGAEALDLIAEGDRVVRMTLLP